jgi:hypothetical protein
MIESVEKLSELQVSPEERERQLLMCGATLLRDLPDRGWHTGTDRR